MKDKEEVCDFCKKPFNDNDVIVLDKDMMVHFRCQEGIQEWDFKNKTWVNKTRN